MVRFLTEIPGGDFILRHLDRWPLLVAIALAAFAVLRVLPLLLMVVDPRRMRCWFGEASEREELLSRSEVLRSRLKELESLGFSRLGLKKEKLPLWGKAGWEMATACHGANAFASVVLTETGDPYIVYFYTLFPEGAFVYTRQQSSLPQLESQDISVKNIPSLNLDELFRSHAERVEGFQRQGRHPLAAGSPESRIEATYRFYESGFARKIIGTTAVLSSIPYLLVAYLFYYIGRKS